MVVQWWKLRKQFCRTFDLSTEFSGTLLRENHLNLLNETSILYQMHFLESYLIPSLHKFLFFFFSMTTAAYKIVAFKPLSVFTTAHNYTLSDKKKVTMFILQNTTVFFLWYSLCRESKVQNYANLSLLFIFCFKIKKMWCLITLLVLCFPS